MFLRKTLRHFFGGFLCGVFEPTSFKKKWRKKMAISYFVLSFVVCCFLGFVVDILSRFWFLGVL
jgi:hypothetical protein